ncbi:MAG: hypothetical protein RB296_10330 [Acidobacteriota bacterium]|nr:hypothetical protein [Acidobacteriota bacterium]
MTGTSGRSRFAFLSWTLGLIFMAAMLAATGYLLRRQAIHQGRLDGLKQELNLADSRNQERYRTRELRAEFYANRFLFSFPGRQARSANNFISLLLHSSGQQAVREWSLSVAGMGLAFRVLADDADELIHRLEHSPDVLRLDVSRDGVLRLRGLVGIR